MPNKKLLILFLAVLVAVFISQRDGGIEKTKYSHPNLFFDEQTFSAGVSQIAKENGAVSYHISGGIIPHHLYPSFIIADFFNRLSKQKPKTIILIGPNHYEKGNFRVLTSLYDWNTPFGKVESDTLTINSLVESNVVKVNEEVLPNDHTIAGILPFIKYYLPDTNIVPLLISNLTTQQESEMIAKILINYVNNDTVIVAPVDFSHYLNSKQAQKKDEETLEVIKSYDFRQLFTFGNDYVDSPSSIAVLLMIMQELGKTKMEIFYHTNSGELQKNNHIETTSYFSMAFY